ncbi:MAG: alpha/beta hydrolase [Flavobacteriaceae bacterium]
MSLEHLYRAPKEQSSKALFLIHGYGSSAHDLFQFASHLPSDLHIFSFQGPYSLTAEQFAWYAIHFDEDQNKFNDLDQARSSLEKIKLSIEELKRTHHLTELVVMGFSQGCILSLALALNHPNFFNAVVGLSGYLNKDLVLDSTTYSTRTRFFMSHGSEDAIIPFNWALESVHFLKEQGLDVSWHEYPSGHTVSYDNFKDLVHFIRHL